jgi:hypothetical protein
MANLLPISPTVLAGGGVGVTPIDMPAEREALAP